MLYKFLNQPLIRFKKEKLIVLVSENQIKNFKIKITYIS